MASSKHFIPTEMKKNIDSLASLKLEIARLTVEQQMQEKLLGGYLKDYARSMSPANLVKNAFKSITGDPEIKSSFKTKGVEAAIGFVVTQLLFKNANPLVRTAASVLGTSFASGIFGDESTKYIDKIKNFYQRFRKKKEDTGAPLFGEEDNYSG